jgi:hypothetical protein
MIYTDDVDAEAARLLLGLQEIARRNEVPIVRRIIPGIRNRTQREDRFGAVG